MNASAPELRRSASRNNDCPNTRPGSLGHKMSKVNLDDKRSLCQRDEECRGTAGSGSYETQLRNTILEHQFVGERTLRCLFRNIHLHNH